jgi:2-oxoglutarate dehydrogenase E1 component
VYVGRDASASPATGSHHVHEKEQKLLVEGAFAPTPSGPIGPGRFGWVNTPESNGNGAHDKTAITKVKAGEPSS